MNKYVFENNIGSYIENLITNIVNNNYQIKKAPITHDFNLQIDKLNTEQNVNYKKELDDIMTDIVTNHFLKEQDEIAHFIKLITTTFDNAIDLYKKKKNINKTDIIFVYKGGNVLRFIINSLIDLLPGDSERILEDNYSDYFKKSDADFTIYINPNLKDYDNIYDNMITMSYYVLNLIRNEISMNRDKYFDFYDLNIEHKKEILNDYLVKLNNASVINDKKYNNEENIYYNKKIIALAFDNICVKNSEFDCLDSNSNRDDFIIDYNKDKSKIIISPIDNNNLTPFYLSVNKTLQFTKGEYFTHFDLVRMKINFKMYFKNEETVSKNLGGEAIDISIQHRDSLKNSKDYNMWYFFKNLNKNITVFTYDNDFSFNATSFYYLIHDLERMLFFEVTLPWDDVKYEKRLNRLFCMYLLDLISIETPGTIFETHNLLVTIKGEILTNINNLNKIKVLLEKYYKLTENKYQIANLFKYTFNLIDKIHKLGEYDEEFNKYLYTILTNLTIMINVQNEIINYLNIKGKVNIDIHNIKQFGSS